MSTNPVSSLVFGSLPTDLQSFIDSAHSAYSHATSYRADNTMSAKDTVEAITEMKNVKLSLGALKGLAAMGVARQDDVREVAKTLSEIEELDTHLAAKILNAFTTGKFKPSGKGDGEYAKAHDALFKGKGVCTFGRFVDSICVVSGYLHAPRGSKSQLFKSSDPVLDAQLMFACWDLHANKDNHGGSRFYYRATFQLQHLHCEGIANLFISACSKQATAKGLSIWGDTHPKQRRTINLNFADHGAITDAGAILAAAARSAPSSSNP